jgi:hypothetical protein
VGPAGAPPLLAPARRKRSHLFVMVGGGVAAAAILIVLVYLGYRQGAADLGEEVAGGSGSREVIDNFYQGGGGLPGANAPARPGLAAAPPTTAAEGKDVPRAGSRPGMRLTPQPRISSASKQDLFPGDDDPQQVTVDDILEKGKIANPAIKQCYNRALKTDPTIRITRMDFRVTVGTSGLVTEVRPLSNAAKSKLLTDCLVGIVKGWRFRKSNEGLTAEFPIVFSNG